MKVCLGKTCMGEMEWSSVRMLLAHQKWDIIDGEWYFRYGYQGETMVSREKFGGHTSMWYLVFMLAMPLTKVESITKFWHNYHS